MLLAGVIQDFVFAASTESRASPMYASRGRRSPFRKSVVNRYSVARALWTLGNRRRARTASTDVLHRRRVAEN